MMNNKGKMSLGIVIIFGLLGLAIIQAVIHDIYYFGQYEDLIGIPIGLMFALPPFLIYRSERKNEHLSDKEKNIANSTTVLKVFILFHLLFLPLIFANNDLEFQAKAIVIIYIVIAVGLALHGINNAKNRPNDYYKIKTYNYKTGESKTYDIYDENGMAKTAEQLSIEMNSDSPDDNPTDSNDSSTRNDYYKSATVLSYNADTSNTSYNYNSYTDSYEDKKESMKKLAYKIHGIFSIIGGLIWELICGWIFYFPRFFKDKTPTSYYMNGIPVSKEEFYSNPIGIIFMLFGIIPIITGIVTLKKHK